MTVPAGSAGQRDANSHAGSLAGRQRSPVERVTTPYRSELNAARTSEEKSSGSSQAAK